MPGDDWVKAHYLDASAMVMLVVDERDCDNIRRFFNDETNFCATPLCLAEAVGVLKRKWNGCQISSQAYFLAAQQLVVHAWSGKIRMDDLGLLAPAVYMQVEATAKERNLDLSDALQLETIRNGYFSGLVGFSASVLITGDGPLELAARAEGIPVWNCRKSERPSWTT